MPWPFCTWPRPSWNRTISTIICGPCPWPVRTRTLGPPCSIWKRLLNMDSRTANGFTTLKIPPCSRSAPPSMNSCPGTLERPVMGSKEIDFRKFAKISTMRYGSLLLLLILLGCGQGKKYHKEGKAFPDSALLSDILRFQQEMDESFRDPESSPLPDRFRKDFDGLDYFGPDTTYVVKAFLERTPEAIPFYMPSTTDTKTLEVVYGIAHFTLNGSEHSLEVYQGLELMKEEGFEDYLFLPFL